MAKSDDSHTDHHGPLLLEGPKSAAADSAPVIDLKPLDAAAADDSASASAEAIAHEPAARSWLTSYAPLAAGIALTAAVGALAGAGTTATLMRDTSPPASFAAADAARALQDSVAQLGSELATLKTGIANAQRSTTTQFGKLAERLDRSEKAQEKIQAEPAAKIAKVQESIDRLEKRQQQAAATPAPAAAPEITGSVMPPKDELRPQVAEGWRLRDFYNGRALVENRIGTLFEVGPGSKVPGLGKVEAIKRENGKVVVVTAGGTIAAAIEARRPSYYRW